MVTAHPDSGPSVADSQNQPFNTLWNGLMIWPEWAVPHSLLDMCPRFSETTCHPTSGTTQAGVEWFPLTAGHIPGGVFSAGAPSRNLQPYRGDGAMS